MTICTKNNRKTLINNVAKKGGKNDLNVSVCSFFKDTISCIKIHLIA